MTSDTEKMVGVEASNSGFNAVSLDLQGNVTASHSSTFAPPDDRLIRLVAFVSELKTRFGEFSKIGLAIPGLVERTSNRVAYSANIPEHAEVDLAGEIKAGIGAEVYIENDANAAAYGEFRLGAGRESRNLFYATLGTGVGGAFIIDGKIWRGVSGFAGEFGYVAINSDGTRLEDVASAESIVRRTRNRFHQDSTSSLSRLDEQKMSLVDIVQAARSEDDFAKMMLERTGAYVGTAIASVINLLNIETIVIGGEIMQAHTVVIDSIIERAKELSFAPSFQSTTIVEGLLGINAAAIGAALLANGEEAQNG
ncbi:MAG: ROK family protein [Pyrinomonadaceae bacterium]